MYFSPSESAGIEREREKERERERENVREKRREGESVCACVNRTRFLIVTSSHQVPMLFFPRNL